MYSLSETAAKKAIKKGPSDFIDFNKDHLSRIYPCASRISSSNFDPAYYWMRGCQMVALNYQTNGEYSMSHTCHMHVTCMSMCWHRYSDAT